MHGLPRAIACALLCCLSSAALAAQELRFWHAMNGALGEQLNALVARFNASQQEVSVQALYKGDYDSLLQAVMSPQLTAHAPALAAAQATAQLSEQQPHIAQIYDAGTAVVMTRPGAIRPVWQVLAEAGVPVRPDSYMPAVASYFSDSTGRLLALPFNSSTPILYYNKAHLRRANLDPGKPPRTWYEMPAMLGELRESGSECPYISAWQSWVQLENMSAWHNQEFATRNNGFDGFDTKLSFNTQLMVRHVSMLSSWAKSRYYIYGGRTGDAESRFARGECSLLTSSSASIAALAAEPGLELGVAPLPYYDDFGGAPFNTLVGGAGLWVLGGLPHNEYRAVARFLSYLMTPEVQAEWHQKTGYVPVTRAAYELSRKQGFYDKFPAQEIAIRQLLAKSPARDSRGIRLGSLDRIREVIDEELEQVWEGRKTPKDALDSAVTRGNALLRRFEQSHTATTRATRPRPARKN